MADWAEPVDVDTAYGDVLEYLKDRDKDAATLFLDDPEDAPNGSIRWNRITEKFQEYDASTSEWDNLDLSAGILIGSMGQQESDAVNIVGGDIGGNVDIDASRLTSGLISPSRLGTGSPSSDTFLAGDQVYRPTTPIGVGALWFTSSPPAGWLICNGQAISRTTYAVLFAILGSIYGSGDGSTTFNLPNLVGKFPFGKAAAGTGSTLAGTFGAIDHTHTGPSHTHAYTDIVNHTHGVTITDPGHEHSYDKAHWDANVTAVVGVEAGNFGDTPTDTETVTTGITAASVNPAGSVASGTTVAAGTGSSGVGNPPGLAINFIIKAL